MSSWLYCSSVLLFAAFLGAAVTSCSDTSRPAAVPHTEPPVFQAEWEIDTWSVTVDDQGNLHVAQFSESDILKYSSDGELIGRSFVIVDRDTLHVASLTYADGRIVALARREVVVLDANYTVITSWLERYNRGVNGGGDLLDVDGSGNIYVLDDNRDLVVKYGPDGSFETEWRVEHTDTLVGLAGIAVTDAGQVFVSDPLRHRILVYAADGRPLLEFRGQYFGPWGLDISAGYLYVADIPNFRVRKSNLHGHYVSDFYSRGTHGQGLDPPESVDVFGNTVFVVHEESIIRFDYSE